jgi:hypothetical protein
LSPAFHRACIHPNFLHPVQVQRNSSVWQKRAIAKKRQGNFALRVPVSGLTLSFVSNSRMIVID